MRAERVPGLSLRGQPVAGWLDALSGLPDLTALLLDNTAVDGAALDRTSLSLDRIYLANTRIDDTAVARIVERWGERLEVIDLEDCEISYTSACAHVPSRSQRLQYSRCCSSSTRWLRSAR